jgi:hypothetical protein
MKVFISPPNETTWRVDSIAFAEELRERFSGIQITKPPQCSQGHALEWTWHAPGGQVDGSLDATANAVVLDGDIADCSRFAVWYRAFVPDTQELVIFDEGYSADLPLLSDTTQALLVATFAAAVASS